MHALQGIEGSYITFPHDYSPEDEDPLQGLRFIVSPTLDPSLRDLAERILPLATYYTAITSFIEARSHLDFGLVNHALCAAMRDMLKDYQTLLAQLEFAFNMSPQFTLQKLWFYVHPTLHTLSLLYLLSTELASADDPVGSDSASNSSNSDDEDDARNEALGLGGAKLKAVLSEINKTSQLGDGSSGIAVKGGEVLAILHERMQNMSGDPAAKELYGALLQAAGRPYVDMVQVWIRTGRLVDPYEELCIKENIQQLVYFLIRLYKVVDDAYTHANRTLLRLLLRDQQLIPRLRSLKRYFFLSQSSFLTHFLDLSHSELRKSARSASLVKLQSLLDLALNTDTQGEDAMFREDVKVTVAGSGLYEWLLNVVNVSGVIGGDDAGVVESTGQNQEETKKEKDDKKQMLAIDALTLDYNVNFPLSLVISRKTILRYQLIFRFLLHLKHVEQSLATMWIEHKTPAWRRPTRPSTDKPATPEPGTKDWHVEFENWRKRVFLLRARMLAFVQQILAFATFEVLEPNWRKLEGKLEAGKVDTVDQLLRDHVDFLDTCLKECMLTSSKLLRAYSRLIVTCSTFALYTAPFTKSATQALSGDTPEAMAKRWNTLGKFEANFNHWYALP
ncbi:hypothetical protein EW026_g1600 [Hermanssonia centrifuga]|uniref:Spindle pole body component n=1 Tax=Hermanssonia centrifuga TaxID=98765 RepID=A0A4S4KVG9_9APHY|nr:hypothetical protein EW026_g1600 [Hermanssonia centrifuga]